MTSFIASIARLPDDNIEELVNLVNSAYRGESSKKGWTTEADLLGGIRTDRKSVKKMMQKPGAIILSATNETNRMVGCVYLFKDSHRLYLGMLTVAPDLQGGGFGKQLLLAAEEYGREINCKVISMSVIDVRHELIGWYKRRGYQRTGEIKPFPSDPSFGIPKQPLQFIVLEKKI